MIHWHITPHAVTRYIERVDRSATREEAYSALVVATGGAHFVRLGRGVCEMWRGPQPTRLRLVVQRSGNRHKLVTVIETFDGLRARK